MQAPTLQCGQRAKYGKRHTDKKNLHFTFVLGPHFSREDHLAVLHLFLLLELEKWTLFNLLETVPIFQDKQI